MKAVSDQAMAKIRTAIIGLAHEPDAPRTKRELERRTALSHDLVARAFKQDLADPERWQLGRLFAELGTGPTRRRTPQEEKILRLTKLLGERNAEIALLKRHLDGAGTAILAMQLEREAFEKGSATPIKNGSRGGRHR